MSTEVNKRVATTINNIKTFFSAKETRIVLMVLLFAFLLRIILSPVMQGHPTDINNFKAWSISLAKVGLGKFFNNVWCDYPPGYLYILWIMGNIYHLFDSTFAYWNQTPFTFLVKFPAIIAETINVALIFYIVRRYAGFQLSLIAAIIYACQPAMIFESAMWGQMDSVSFLVQLLSIWALTKNNNIMAIVLTAIGILLKPQGLILLPLILFVAIRRKAWFDIFMGGIISVLCAVLFSMPFTNDAPLLWLWEHYMDQAALYPYSAIQTFNLWSFTGLWKSDMRTIFGITHSIWGMVIFVCAYIGILIYVYLKDKDGESLNSGALIFHASTLILIAFFLFPTRMHERYLFSGLSFLAISAALNYKWRIPYLLFSLTFLINDFYELPGVKDGFPPVFKAVNSFLSSGQMFNDNFGLFWYQPFTVLNLVLFGYLVYLAWKYMPIDTRESQMEELRKHFAPIAETLQKPILLIPKPVKLDKLDFILILALMLITTWLKLYRLDMPAEMVFDEVYHARAGGEYLNWIHPFEWVHPPLAKLLIALGVMMYDLTAFGWRMMPLLFGSLFVPFLYILAKNIFNNRWWALIGTAIFTFDGVYFVQSRTAMTNIFAILFQVMSLSIFFMYFQQAIHHPEKGNKYYYLLAAGISIGLALATRWTSLWTWGFMWLCLIFYKLIPEFTLKDLIGIVRHKEWNIKLKPFDFTFWLISFGALVCIPFMVYFCTYIPYMLMKHSLWDAITMQAGIWSYHANLRDPHPYYSEWYTWPFLTRPTWYYFHTNKDTTISGIIALGNPAIWWATIPAFFFTLWQAYKKKSVELYYIAFAFFVLYIMWGLSPRIKNFSHYFLEALPYACLCITYCVKTLWEKMKSTRYVAIVYLVLILACFIFFYPLYTAYPIPANYYNLHIWFRSWV